MTSYDYEEAYARALQVLGAQLRKRERNTADSMQAAQYHDAALMLDAIMTRGADVANSGYAVDGTGMKLMEPSDGADLFSLFELWALVGIMRRKADGFGGATMLDVLNLAKDAEKGNRQVAFKPQAPAPNAPQPTKGLKNMLGIAIAHALAEAGFGKVNKNILCEWRVPEIAGVWPYGTLFVNTTTIGADNGILTDRVTLTPNARNQAEQTLILLSLLHWVDTLAQTGTLTCGPECDVRFQLTSVSDNRTTTKDTRQRSGRWAESLNFNVSYRLPDLPGMETTNRIKGADAQNRVTPPDGWSTLVDDIIREAC